MRKFVEDFFALVMLVGTEAWFLKGYYSHQPDFESALAFLAALGVVLAKDPIRAKFVASDKSASVHDKKLFESFTELLPPSQITKFFKEHDFGDSFLKSDVTPLYSFVETWNCVDKEFIDKELETEKKAVYALASGLTKEIVVRTVPLRGGDTISVFSDHQRATGKPRAPSVIEDAKVINEKSSIFLKKYEEFIRLCRKKLA